MTAPTIGYSIWLFPVSLVRVYLGLLDEFHQVMGELSGNADTWLSTVGPPVLRQLQPVMCGFESGFESGFKAF